VAREPIKTQKPEKTIEKKVEKTEKEPEVDFSNMITPFDRSEKPDLEHKLTLMVERELKLSEKQRFLPICRACYQ